MKKIYRITMLALLCVFLTATGCKKTNDPVSDQNVELGDYKNLKVTVEKGTVTEENVISYINRMLEYNPGEITYEELTDEYVKNNMQDQGYTSVQELKEAVSEYLNGTNDYYAQNNTRAAVVEKLTEICSVKEIDAEILQQRVSEYEAQFKKNCKTQYNMEFEEYLEMCQMTEEDFHEQAAKSMEQSLTEELILLAIGKKEGIALDEKKYAEFVETMMQRYQYETEDALYEALGKTYIENACLCDQTLTMLVENAAVTYVAPGELD